MPLRELMDQLESQGFAARVMIASSNKVFFTALSSDTVFRNLVTHLEAHPNDTEEVIARLRNLAVAQVDYRYQNPHDAALAAYVWALTGVDQRLGSLAAEIASGAPQIWWGRQVATAVLQRETVSLGNSQVTFSFAAASADLATASVLSSDVPDYSFRSGLLASLADVSILMPSSLTLRSADWEVNPFAWALTGEPIPVVKVVNPVRREDEVPLRWVA